MRVPRWKDITRWPAARLSAAVLYVLLGVAAVVFVLFYLVGFSRLSAEDPNFTEPRLTSLLLVFLWVMMGLALVMAVVSVVRSLRVRDKQQSRQNGIPFARIAVGTGCGLVQIHRGVPSRQDHPYGQRAHRLLLYRFTTHERGTGR